MGLGATAIHLLRSRRGGAQRSACPMSMSGSISITRTFSSERPYEKKQKRVVQIGKPPPPYKERARSPFHDALTLNLVAAGLFGDLDSTGLLQRFWGRSIFLRVRASSLKRIFTRHARV